MTQVTQMMTRGVRAVAPSDVLQQAAEAMDDLNVGVLPVCEEGRVVGMVTDRDITVRGVARGCAPDRTTVSEVMSQPVETCYEDESVDDVMQKMSTVQIRRLAVLDRQERLVGILSLGDLAAKGEIDTAADALSDISEPAQPDRPPAD